MKKWFGSIDNRLAENTIQKIPMVGMGATAMYYSDRNPYTILEVSKDVVAFTCDVEDKGQITTKYPKYILAKEDKAKLISGSCMSEHQVYEFSNDGKKNGAELFVFHKPSGVYRRASVGKRTNAEQISLIIGRRDKYYDPSF